MTTSTLDFDPAARTETPVEYAREGQSRANLAPLGALLLLQLCSVMGCSGLPSDEEPRRAERFRRRWRDAGR